MRSSHMWTNPLSCVIAVAGGALLIGYVGVSLACYAFGGSDLKHSEPPREATRHSASVSPGPGAAAPSPRASGQEK